MQRTALFVLMLFVLLLPVQAQTVRTFLNPGVKIGYVFGVGGGFIAGLECSYTRLRIDRRTISTGVTAAVDWSNGMVKYHCGVQYFADGWGVEWGPSYLRTEGRAGITTSTTVFTWLVALPYLSATFGGPIDPYMEVGAYLKAPALLTGPDFKQ